MLDGFEGSAQPTAAIRRKPLNSNRVRRQYSLIDVFDLLRKHQFDKRLLRLSERIEIEFGADC